MNNKHPNCFGNVNYYEWTDAFYHKDFTSFFNIFDSEVTQSASTSPFVFFGSNQVAETFTWASDFYQRCDFLHQASSPSLMFLEFDLTTLNGMHMTGMTVLTKNDSGKVIKVFNGHRNLTETVIFTEHFVRGRKNKGIVSMFHNKAMKKYGLTLKYPRNVVNINATIDVSEKEYIDAFKCASEGAFRAILDSSVKLSASYVTKTITGQDKVSQVLSKMSGFYEHCLFISQANHENRTYLLYQGNLRNDLKVSDGFLILVRNKSGKIVEVLDNPIPMHAGTIISSYLAGCFSHDSFFKPFFYSEHLFKEAVTKYSLENVYGSKTRDLSSFKGVLAQLFIRI